LIHGPVLHSPRVGDSAPPKERFPTWNGADRAKYGARLLEILSDAVWTKGVKDMTTCSLRLYRQFFLSYESIWQALPAKLRQQRPRRISAARRNDFVAALADDAYVPHLSPSGQTVRIAEMLAAWTIPHVTGP